MAGKTVESVDCERVAQLAEVAHAGKNSGGGGQRQLELFDLGSHLGCENCPGGGAVDRDVVRLVSFEEFFVDSDDIVESSGKGMFGGQAIEYGDHFAASEVGDGN